MNVSALQGGPFQIEAYLNLYVMRQYSISYKISQTELQKDFNSMFAFL